MGSAMRCAMRSNTVFYDPARKLPETPTIRIMTCPSLFPACVG